MARHLEDLRRDDNDRPVADPVADARDGGRKRGLKRCQERGRDLVGWRRRIGRARRGGGPRCVLRTAGGGRLGPRRTRFRRGRYSRFGGGRYSWFRRGWR